MRIFSRTLLFVLTLIGMVGCVSLAQPTFSPTPTATLGSPTQTASPTQAPRPVPYHFSSPESGANIHMWWDRWASQRDWHVVHDIGMTWAKQRLPWRNVKPAQDAPYDWSASDMILEEAEAWGVNLVFRLDGTPDWAQPGGEGLDGPPADFEDFGAFCYDVAARYRGQVRGYQIWNEPNLAREWGGAVPDPAAYADLLRVCSTQIKRADPQALVFTAGLAPTRSGPPVAISDRTFLAGMYEAGAAPYFDLLGLNAPGYAAPPEVSPDEAAFDPAYGGFRFFCFRYVEDMRGLMEFYGDGHKQVAILEFGWTTDTLHPAYAWFAVTPEEQADYLVRAFAYAREHWDPWIGPMFVWNIPDPTWTPEDEEFWWAIVDPFDWEENEDPLRPAYRALVGME